LPPEGLGDPGSEKRLVDVLAPKGLWLPNEDLRPFTEKSSPLLAKGLPMGEYGEPPP